MLPIDQSFDIDLANQLGDREVHNKHYHRPNTYLHKWWARRCGSTFRLILKHLTADPDYYAGGGLEGKIILDSMMGGGTTLHEAIRLGANVIGADIEPIPVLQARATLSDIPLNELEPAFAAFYEGLQQELAPWFMTQCRQCGRNSQLRHVLYGLQRACACREVITVDSFLVYAEDQRRIILCPQCREVHGYKEPCPAGRFGDALLPPLIGRTQDNCSNCGRPFKEDTHRPFYTRYTAVVVIGECPEHGLFWARPSTFDYRLIEQADRGRTGLALHDHSFLFRVPSGEKSRNLVSRGIENFLDVFTSRQLLYVDSAARHLKELPTAVRLKLALLVSTSLEFNALLCGYKGASDIGKARSGAVRHVFSRHGYTFPYTAVENNPLVASTKASGSVWALYYHRIRRAVQWAAAPVEFMPDGTTISIPGEVDLGREVYTPDALREGSRRFMLLHQSATCLPLPANSVDHVVTDPPYLDSVQYSDLAAFFRGFLQLLAPAEGVNWQYDPVETAAVSHERHYLVFAQTMGEIFSECTRVLKPGGRLIFTFHHWKPEAWAALTIALKRAGFSLITYYVVKSESPQSVHINAMRAITHDVILVLAKGIIEQPYRPVLKVDHTDSRRFCDGCGHALAWMLTKDVPVEEVIHLWQRILS